MWLKQTFQKRIVLPIRAQLLLGANPRDLAMSCAVGVALGSFPLFGTTTILALIVGFFMRLNQPTLQSVNYLMSPIQLLLIPVFGYFAAHLGTPLDVDVHPQAIIQKFAAGPAEFWQMYGVLGMRAIAIWAVVAPFYSFVIFRILHVAFKSFFGPVKL
jgi:uncharacterized protein (DUF2062 family)